MLRDKTIIYLFILHTPPFHTKKNFQNNIIFMMAYIYGKLFTARSTFFFYLCAHLKNDSIESRARHKQPTNYPNAFMKKNKKLWKIMQVNSLIIAIEVFFSRYCLHTYTQTHFIVITTSDSVRHMHACRLGALNACRTFILWCIIASCVTHFV